MTLLSVEEYLNTAYDPDVEFVDGVLVVIEKLKEYANKGVPNIWLIDPRLQLLCKYRPPTLVEIEGDTIHSPDGSVERTRDEIFAE